MRVTILGSGGASGIPTVAHGWGLCDPANPRNRRLRPSILVENEATTVLVDTSPDLRQQLLTADVRRLDAVIFTHAHADHVNGIDDLRPINRAINAPLDAYGDRGTLDDLHKRFGYVFEPLAEGATMFYKPTLIAHEIAPGDSFTIGDVPVTTVEQDHGWVKTLGLRFGPIAYTTDAVELPEAAFEMLAGIDTWIIGVLIDTPHPTHAHVGKALDWIERVGPRRAVLTHLSSRLDHDTLNASLPDHVEPAYDGMVLEAEG